MKDTLEGHQGSVFQLMIAHGYIWSEAADGTRVLWKPFVTFPSRFSTRADNPVSFQRCGNIKDTLKDKTRKDVLDLQ